MGFDMVMENTVTSVMLDSKALAPKPDRMLGIRHLQVGLLFLGVLLSYTQRVNLSVAIVAMVDKDSGFPGFPEYDWSTGTQAVVLSSFFWGYVVTQIPAGIMLNIFGAKIMMLVALSVSSIFSVLTPLAADWGDWRLVVAFRVILGLAQGYIFPSTQSLLTSWTPVADRGVMNAFVHSGGLIGTVIALIGSGVLATSSWGWPSTFYVFGALGVAWSVLWLFLGSNSPAVDRLTSQEERQYIEDSLGSTMSVQENRVIPLQQIVTSLPVWAITAATCGNSWGFWTLLTKLPTFMKTVLAINLNSYYSSLPYLAMFLLSFVVSWSAEAINHRKLVSLTSSRKIFNSIGQFGPCVALVAMSFTTDPTLVIVLLTIAVGLNAGIYLGFSINHIDLAPNYAGTLMGITNGLGQLMGILAPLIVGVVVTDNSSASQWRIVFFIAAAIYFVSGLIFLMFATAQLQPWNDFNVQVEDNKRTGAAAVSCDNNAFDCNENMTNRSAVVDTSVDNENISCVSLADTNSDVSGNTMVMSVVGDISVANENKMLASAVVDKTRENENTTCISTVGIKRVNNDNPTNVSVVVDTSVDNENTKCMSAVVDTSVDSENTKCMSAVVDTSVDSENTKCLSAVVDTNVNNENYKCLSAVVETSIDSENTKCMSAVVDTRVDKN